MSVDKLFNKNYLNIIDFNRNINTLSNIVDNNNLYIYMDISRRGDDSTINIGRINGITKEIYVVDNDGHRDFLNKFQYSYKSSRPDDMGQYHDYYYLKDNELSIINPLNFRNVKYIMGNDFFQDRLIGNKSKKYETFNIAKKPDTMFKLNNFVGVMDRPGRVSYFANHTSIGFFKQYEGNYIETHTVKYEFKEEPDYNGIREQHIVRIRNAENDHTLYINDIDIYNKTTAYENEDEAIDIRNCDLLTDNKYKIFTRITRPVSSKYVKSFISYGLGFTDETYFDLLKEAGIEKKMLKFHNYDCNSSRKYVEKINLNFTGGTKSKINDTVIKKDNIRNVNNKIISKVGVGVGINKRTSTKLSKITQESIEEVINKFEEFNKNLKIYNDTMEKFVNDNYRKTIKNSPYTDIIDMVLDELDELTIIDYSNDDDIKNIINELIINSNKSNKNKSKLNMLYDLLLKNYNVKNVNWDKLIIAFSFNVIYIKSNIKDS